MNTVPKDCIGLYPSHYPPQTGALSSRGSYPGKACGKEWSFPFPACRGPRSWEQIQHFIDGHWKPRQVSYLPASWQGSRSGDRSPRSGQLDSVAPDVTCLQG